MHEHMGSVAGFATLSLWSAFALGLVGGFAHCLAMCGPFVAAASLTEGAVSRGPSGCAANASAPSGGRAALFQAAYHGGRILTYVIICGLLGLLGGAGAIASLGGSVSFGGITAWVSTIAGVGVIALGGVTLVTWAFGGRARLPETGTLIARSTWFTRTTRRLVGAGPKAAFPLGMLMGLVPCAPLLPVELAALATGVPLYGGMLALAFGLGTVPALAGFGIVSGLFGRSSARWLEPVTALLVIALGVAMVANGLLLAAG